MSEKDSRTRIAIGFSVLALAALGGLTYLGFGIRYLPTYNVYTDPEPAHTLPVLILVGTAAMLLSLVFTATAFAALGLADRSFALGLPQGSIRALIALLLISIFAITSIYLFGQLDYKIHVISNLNEEQKDALLEEMPEDIISIEPTRRDVAADGYRYNVYRKVDHTQSSVDFAQQLLTTISTLVVAVAGFYFGTKAVAAAKEAITQPTLRILNPDSKSARVKQGKKLPIRIETEPFGLMVNGDIDGDAKDSLKSIRYDKFEYEPKAPSDEPVTLTFSLGARPGVTKELKVEVQKDETEQTTSKPKLSQGELKKPPIPESEPPKEGPGPPTLQQDSTKDETKPKG